MQKILTALGNNRLNEALEKTKKYEIVTRDITYTDGILEALEEYPNVDTIIISEILDGSISFRDLILEILRIKNKIEIIVFVEEKTPEIQHFLYSNGIIHIYSNNEIEIDKFIEKLGGKPVHIEEIKENRDVDELVTIRKIGENNEIKTEIDFKALGKIIAVAGSYNSGKSLVSYMLANEYAKQNRKVLLVDFDIFNNSISLLFNIKRYNNNASTWRIENQTMSISKNLDVLCAMDLVFGNDNLVDYINLEDMFQEFRRKYGIIIIDTTSNFKYKYLSRILNNCDVIMYLIVPSKLEIKKSFEFMEVFENDFKIPQGKFQIILNKVSSNSHKNLINENFEKFKITSEIKFDEKMEDNINYKTIDNMKEINKKIGGF